MELEGKSVVVVGLARSGIAAARFLAGHGARVVATDSKPASEISEEGLSLEWQGVRLELGGHPADLFTGVSLVVVSPGVPWNMPDLEAARRSGVSVVAELEFASRNLVGTVAAVTGTKGKSTTTAALGAMLREAGLDTRVGGNIGAPLSGLLDGAQESTVFAVEASSFQLEGTDTFHPKVAVFLNLSADHLDRHASFDEYAQAKARIFRNQTADDWAIVNGHDPRVMELARGTQAHLVVFSPRDQARPHPLSERDGDIAYFEGGLAQLRRGGQTETLFDRDSVQLPGAHLAGDLLAAAVAARLLGAPTAAIARAVANFRGVEHVLEFVAEANGVRFFNDSKATNIDAARKSLEAFEGPILAIMGGHYKGGDFVDLRGAVAARCKRVLAIGETRQRIQEALGPIVPVVSCASMEEAVEKATAEAVAGDIVLLAPACSSFDMFVDYADRGRAFKDAVRKRLASHG